MKTYVPSIHAPDNEPKEITESGINIMEKNMKKKTNKQTYVEFKVRLCIDHKEENDIYHIIDNVNANFICNTADANIVKQNIVSVKILPSWYELPQH